METGQTSRMAPGQILVEEPIFNNCRRCFKDHNLKTGLECTNKTKPRDMKKLVPRSWTNVKLVEYLGGE